MITLRNLLLTLLALVATPVSADWVLNNALSEVSFITIKKENVAETVIADGFRTWDEICVGEFQQYCP